jgi:hypothetical protein
MKTTIELPDDLYRRVKAKSALEGKTVREVATSLFQQWADGTVPRGQDPDAEHASADDEGRRRREAWLAEWQALAEELGRLAPEGGVVEQLLRDRR